MKRALISGISGQDGSYLAELLISKGYEVQGLPREAVEMRRAVSAFVPDEVYNLGGVTDLKTAYAEPDMTWRANYEYVAALLEASLKANPSVRFLQASSSEIFLPSPTPLNEESPRDWNTENPYAKAKLAVDRDLIVRSRNAGAFCCSAILFNHESPRRSEKSVLRKICRTFAKIKLGLATSLQIGNVEVSRDWGYAPDYVEAMWRMLQKDMPEDFVLATGQLHTVREAIDIAARYAGIDSSGIIETVPEYYRPAEQYPKVGDNRKANALLGWKPTVDLRSMIELMVQSDLDELSKA